MYDDTEIYGDDLEDHMTRLIRLLCKLELVGYEIYSDPYFDAVDKLVFEDKWDKISFKFRPR